MVTPFVYLALARRTACFAMFRAGPKVRSLIFIFFQEALHAVPRIHRTSVFVYAVPNVHASRPRTNTRPTRIQEMVPNTRQVTYQPCLRKQPRKQHGCATVESTGRVKVQPGQGWL
ncbi:hypothetical protein EDB85DRAFT_283797 [Lactarius pseudohatsudake]|nr:hypothetical protein EDB85DRAFT_283797 [Lactarius pseudohatsudake]